MRLNFGKKAIPFTVKDIANNEISLKSYKGKKILLSFYRYASCPLCNLRVSELIQLMPEFEKNNLQLIAIFQSPKESIMEYVGKQDVPFPIIADPKRELYKLYGVESSFIGYIKGLMKVERLIMAVKKGFNLGKIEGSKTQLPADFILDEKRKIISLYYGKDIGDHMPVEMIFKTIK